MDRFQAMRLFVKVAETASFAESGRQLGMSPPAVTRTIAALEAEIGVRLLIRSTRSVKLTEAGTRYCEDCRRILADIVEAEASAAGAHANPTGTLTITGSTMFGTMYILPILLDYLDLYPAVTGRSLFVDRIVNIIDEGVDVAVRIGHLPDSSLTAVRVGSVRRLVCGAPSYFERHGIPRAPADLVHHRIIAPTSAWASPDWQFGWEKKTSVTVHPQLQCNTIDATLAAAERGWGLTRLLSYQIGPALIEGRLQAVLVDHEEPAMPIHLVHAAGRHASAKVRAFVDLAAERLRGNPLFA